MKVPHGSYRTRFATQIKKFLDGWNQYKTDEKRCLEKIEYYKPKKDDREDEAQSNAQTRKSYEDELIGHKADLKAIVVEGNIIKEGCQLIINGGKDVGQEEGRRKSSVEDDVLEDMIKDEVEKAIKKFINEDIKAVVKSEAEKTMKREGAALIALVEGHVKKNVPVDLVSRLTTLEDMNER